MECLLTEPIRKEVFSYMSGVLTNKQHKSIIVNGYSDHVHVFFGLNPTMSISDIVSDLKRSSSLFINEKKWYKGTFQWQEGYGAFSYSKSYIETVYNYILNQKEHHKKIRLRKSIWFCYKSLILNMMIGFCLNSLIMYNYECPTGII